MKGLLKVLCLRVKDPNPLDTRLTTQRIPKRKEGDFTFT